MVTNLFFVESMDKLTEDDLFNLRSYYLPLIGVESTIIYEYFNDLTKNNYNDLFSCLDLENQMNIPLNKINQAILKLSAVGLIKEFIKTDQTSKVFVLQKPLSIDNFNKNMLLKNHLIKIIGITKYENLYYSYKQRMINKSEYIETTSKYQDVFKMDFIENIENVNYSTLELEVSYFEKHEDNVQKLASYHFGKYLLKRNLTSFENQLINFLLKLGFNDSSINLLFDFCYRQNSRLVINYIKTIATDFKNRSILSYKDVQHEILIIESAKQYKKNVIIENEDFLTNKTNSSINVIKSNEISVFDVLTLEDMEEMF